MMTFWPHGLNLRQRLALLLLLVTVPGMVVAVVLAIYALGDRGRQIETTAGQLASLQAAQHGGVMDSARIMLDALIAGEVLRDMSQARCNAFLTDWIDKYLSFTALLLLDDEGQIVCASRIDEIPFDPAGRPWFDRVRSTVEFTVGNYAFSPNQTPLVLAGQPVLDAGGSFVGAVAVTIDLRWLEFLARRVDLPAGATVTALASDGSVLSHHVVPGPGDRGQVEQAVPASELRSEMVARGTGTLRGPNEDGEPRTYGFDQTDVGGLVIAVGMPPYLAFARYGAALRDTLMAPLAILFLALAAAWWGAEHLITRWVRSLTRTTRRMASGDLHVRSEVPHSSYEIGELATAFDAMAQNIQERQEELRSTLEERETLLRELHHRVKNNMQMVISLINLHAHQITDDPLRRRLDDIRHRIQALATIHDLLFQREPRGRLTSQDYVRRVAESLSQLYQSEAGGIEVDLNVAPVRLPTDQAIPFGLILSELVSNAHKHGFADGGEGRIRVDLEVEHGDAGEDVVRLSVSDDGVGPAEGIDPLRATSTGLQVVDALVRQLDGELVFERRAGWSSFHLRFPLAARAS